MTVREPLLANEEQTEEIFEIEKQIANFLISSKFNPKWTTIALTDYVCKMFIDAGMPKEEALMLFSQTWDINEQDQSK